MFKSQTIIGIRILHGSNRHYRAVNYLLLWVPPPFGKTRFSEAGELLQPSGIWSIPCNLANGLQVQESLKQYHIDTPSDYAVVICGSTFRDSLDYILTVLLKY